MSTQLSVEQAQKLHYAQIRKRLFTPKLKKPEPIEPPPIVAAPAPPAITFKLPKKVEVKPVKIRRLYQNIWEICPTHFNHHVISYRRHLLEVETGVGRVMENERKSVVDIVAEVLVDYPGVSISDIKGAHRKRAIVEPRQIAMYEVYRQREDMSFPAIGRWFGNRDHTTVLHAVRKVAACRGEAA